MNVYIKTPRLILREWKEEDIPEFARLNSDDRVMEYFLKKLSYEETLEFYNRIQEEFAQYGFGLYAVERTEDNSFMGYVGFHNVAFDVDFAPAIEIGWRLLPEFWNKGYATEAAMACLEYARNELKLTKIVSFTSLQNKRSERVMQKIGMTRVKEFNHPLVAQNHPLLKHILYMHKPKIKLIAADMDGTLLNSKGELSPDLFPLLGQLNQQGILFAAASGRQYYNLLNRFDAVKDEIIFIADNGTFVAYQGKELLVVDFAKNFVDEIIKEVRKIEGAYLVLGGKKKAYIEDTLPEFEQQTRKYCERCVVVPDLLEVVDDQFLKIAVYDFKEAATNSYPLLKHFDDRFTVVVSGKNWVDISNREANKGRAIALVQELFHISPDETMAFGDQMNDKEMMEDAYFSYAMENAVDGIKEISNFSAPSNDENGVISVINDYIRSHQ